MRLLFPSTLRDLIDFRYVQLEIQCAERSRLIVRAVEGLLYHAEVYEVLKMHNKGALHCIGQVTAAQFFAESAASALIP